MSQKINEIDIRITKAFVKSISFGFSADESMPNITIGVDLLTASNKKISEVSFSTMNYYGTKIEQDSIPASVHGKIVDIMNSITPIIIRKINSIEGLVE